MLACYIFVFMQLKNISPSLSLLNLFEFLNIYPLVFLLNSCRQKIFHSRSIEIKIFWTREFLSISYLFNKFFTLALTSESWFFFNFEFSSTCYLFEQMQVEKSQYFAFALSLEFNRWKQNNLRVWRHHFF